MYAQKILKRIVYFLLILSLASYTGYKIYAALAAPKIEIYYPRNGELVDPVFTITGKVEKANKIHLFDREIYTDQEGYFKETMIATDNYTDIIIKASNRWDRQSVKTLTVENIKHREDQDQQ